MIINGLYALIHKDLDVKEYFEGKININNPYNIDKHGRKTFLKKFD